MTAPLERAVSWLPYQRAWIKDQSRFKIGMFTRRGGKTFGSSGEIVDDCTLAEIDGRKVRWTILSRSENTAKEALNDALKPLTRAFYAAYSELAKRGEPTFVEDAFHVPAHYREVRQGDRVFKVDVPEATYKTHEVHYPGGSRVIALSASPDAARGFGGNLLLDEFAFHADSRAIWASAYPVAARGGHKIRVISTPNGKGNKFYELMTAENNVWSKHVVDIYEAVRQGLDVNIDELRAGMADEDAWAQEFELKWLDEASSWLDYDLISECERDWAGQPGLYEGGQVFVGVDIAARNDLFVIWVDELVRDRLVTREIIAKKRVTFAEQDRLLDDVFDRYRVVRAAMDQTGMGEKPVEDAKRRYGESRVDGVLFSAARKLEMATVLKERMQDRTKLIPAGDPLLRADLHAIKSRVGATGIRRLVVDGDTDGHGDRFWAGALAAAAAQTDYQPYAYQPVSADPRGDDDRPIRLTAGFGAAKGVW
ncbi:terminase family protein [Maritimibacter sp. HL-12]|uniref:terminase large subunit domain-containing protein n=1 Tax=Maritimibacter sp. HL-12 TaxID=1162418 RepID=UPI000A0EF69B|nr:terminase family protein [Maritimibacter sp. HL-12]SMH35923.1 Mu-like prophage FluMu protein gp28 [Maritimibacter sp. HL-12]